MKKPNKVCRILLTTKQKETNN